MTPLITQLSFIEMENHLTRFHSNHEAYFATRPEITKVGDLTDALV
jgi:hypothetical protein